MYCNMSNQTILIGVIGIIGVIGVIGVIEAIGFIEEIGAIGICFHFWPNVFQKYV